MFDLCFLVKEILDKTADVLYPNTFRLNLKKLVNTTESGYREALRSVFLTKSTKIILDCSKDTLFEVMTQVSNNTTILAKGSIVMSYSLG